MYFDRVLFLATFFLVIINFGYAQNLESLSVKKGFDISGSINMNGVGYYAHGIEQRRDQFNWFLTGSLNVKLFGYDAPFSFSYSNANTSFSQPFNQFSFQPQYKWVKTYVGYNSMNLSNYTLAGHVFFGGGVELSPGKWRFSAMYGRLRKAVPFDLEDSTQHYLASFKRMGYGFKAGYDNNGDAVSFTLFTAADDVNSIPFVLQESQLTPMKNVAMSLAFRKKLGQHFFVEAEYGISSLITDVRANTEADSVSVNSSNLIQALLPENSTSRYFDALNASVGYQGSIFSLSLRYERIAPEYQTLGAYYFNNDIRNITIVPSVRLLQNKLNLAANVGFQRNNLDDARASTTERFVGSLNANYVPDEKWNFTCNYSNFSSYTNMRPLADPFFQNSLDTLNFYQVSQTLSSTAVRTIGNSQKPQSLMLTVSYQTANDESAYEGGDVQSNFLTTNMAYSYTLVATHTTIGAGTNVYANNAAGVKSTYWGPMINITQSLFDKMVRISWACSYNKTSGNNISSSPVLNNRVGMSLTPRSDSKSGRHNFSIGLNLVNRLKDTAQQKAFSELTGTVSYGYLF